MVCSSQRVSTITFSRTSINSWALSMLWNGFSAASAMTSLTHRPVVGEVLCSHHAAHVEFTTHFVGRTPASAPDPLVRPWHQAQNGGRRGRRPRSGGTAPQWRLFNGPQDHDTSAVILLKILII